MVDEWLDEVWGKGLFLYRILPAVFLRTCVTSCGNGKRANMQNRFHWLIMIGKVILSHLSSFTVQVVLKHRDGMALG